MADLLPSTPDTSAVEEADPRVIGVDSEDADELLSALSSATSRELLAALHEEPANPAALADQVDTTIQNAQYHLGKLDDAGLIEVIDTVYSEKGREMNVYAPSDRPLVVFAGREEETTGLRAALSRLLGALAALAFSSVLFQGLFGGGFGDLPGFAGGGEPSDVPGPGAGTSTPEATSTPAPNEVRGFENATAADTSTPAPTGTEAPTATPSPAETAATATDVLTQVSDAVAGLPPGALFFAGGATVLLVGFAFWYRARE